MSEYLDKKIQAMTKIPLGKPPCAEPRIINGKTQYMKPSVDCSNSGCVYCGWNPVVQKQRLINSGYIR